MPEPGLELKSANIKFVAPFFSISHSLLLVYPKLKKLLSILKCVIFQENVGHKNEILSFPCSTLNNIFSSYVKLSFNFQNFFNVSPQPIHIHLSLNTCCNSTSIKYPSLTTQVHHSSPFF